MRTKHLCVLIHIRIKGEVGTVKLFYPSSNFLTGHSKVVLLSWIFFFHIVLSLSCNLVVTCWERADLLAVMYVTVSCVLSLSHTVYCVRCGTGVYGLQGCVA